MQNIPRIFLNQDLNIGKIFPVGRDIVHYLRHVMRRGDCLVFNNGYEYHAVLSDDDKNIIVQEKTDHDDVSNYIVLCFAPIKKTDELLNMATQMGVCAFQPVITDRTVAHHINWQRMEKILIEASEQSNRNSVPKLLPPVKFEDFDLSGVVVADERAAHGKSIVNDKKFGNKILIGPEGGFSESEFEKMDAFGVCGVSLGKTILRAEVATVVAITKVLNQ